MAKIHVETKKVSTLWDFGGYHYETHICEDGNGKNAVTGYGFTPTESRERAMDKFTAKQLSEISEKAERR
jgi:hypothetical protein